MITVVTTGAERRLAVEHWLLSTVADRRRARDDWARHPLTMMPCGLLFAAIRIPSRLLHAAAGSTDRTVVDQVLLRALDGPVICDQHAALHYALVPVGVARWWTVPDTICLGKGAEVAVPRLDSDPDRERIYWSVPMDSPGTLCMPDDVTRAVMVGRARAAVTGG